MTDVVGLLAARKFKEQLDKGEPLAVPFAPSEHIGMILALIAAAIVVAWLYTWARGAAKKTAEA